MKRDLTANQYAMLERIRTDPGHPEWHYADRQKGYRTMRSLRERGMLEEYGGGLYLLGTAPRVVVLRHKLKNREGGEEAKMRLIREVSEIVNAQDDE